MRGSVGDYICREELIASSPYPHANDSISFELDHLNLGNCEAALRPGRAACNGEELTQTKWRFGAAFMVSTGNQTVTLLDPAQHSQAK
jgi:hypothetical protein